VWLIATLLVSVIVLSGVRVGAMLGDAIDPFALAGV
jgi:hypothetical protein